MVQAIEKNQKRQTRRIIKPQPYYIENGWQWDGNRQKAKKATGSITVCGKDVKPETDEFFPASAKYKIGDILWVRETFLDISELKDSPLFHAHDKGDFVFKADNEFIGCHNWKPSIYMPKDAARYFLKVTNVRCERLQDISEEDSKKEGTTKGRFLLGPNMIKKQFQLEHSVHGSHYEGFKYIWHVINGAESWKANPWVFVYDFEKIEKPQNWPL